MLCNNKRVASLPAHTVFVSVVGAGGWRGVDPWPLGAHSSAVKGQAKLLAGDSCSQRSALSKHLLISMFAV